MCCLVHHYALEFSESDSSLKNPVGSVQYFARESVCVDCTRWDSDIETILTWRDVDSQVENQDTKDNDDDDDDTMDVDKLRSVPESIDKVKDTKIEDISDESPAETKFKPNDVDKPADTTVSEIAAKTREYLVKFKGLSHIHNAWVPEYWILSIKKERAGLQRFLKKVEDENSFAKHRIFKAKKPDWPKAEEEVVNSDWTKVAEILDVEFFAGARISSSTARRKKKRTGGSTANSEDEASILNVPPVEDLETVFVKWAGLPFDEATWEHYPTEENDADLDESDLLTARRLRSEIAVAYNKYVRGLEISMRSPKKETRRFKEFKEQPINLKGGQLKDYQMDGLKYVSSNLNLISWMLYQWHKNTSSILADDMGLGKTIQISMCYSVALIF